MDVAEWIIVGILAATLLIFLIVGIVAFLKWREVAEEATKIIVKGQDVVDTANDVVENVRDFTSVGKIIKAVSDTVIEDRKKPTKPKKESK